MKRGTILAVAIVLAAQCVSSMASAQTEPFGGQPPLGAGQSVRMVPVGQYA